MEKKYRTVSNDEFKASITSCVKRLGPALNQLAKGPDDVDDAALNVSDAETE